MPWGFMLGKEKIINPNAEADTDDVDDDVLHGGVAGGGDGGDRVGAHARRGQKLLLYLSFP